MKYVDVEEEDATHESQNCWNEQCANDSWSHCFDFFC